VPALRGVAPLPGLQPPGAGADERSAPGARGERRMAATESTRLTGSVRSHRGSFRTSAYISDDTLVMELTGSASSSEGYADKSDATAPPRHATWPTVTQLLIADIVGPAVMAIANAFAALGWLFGLIFLVLMLPINIYCGVLVWETQVEEHPGTLTLADVSRAALGPVGYWAAGLSVYSFIFMVLGLYVVTLGECLQLLSVGVSLPARLWSLIGAATVLPFAQVRTLNATRLLLLVNNLTILICVLCILIHFWAGGAIATGYTGTTAAIAPDLTWRSFASGLSTLAFAYVGVLLYPELISEMEQPHDFPKALYCSAPVQLLFYALVGCVGYGYLGSGAHGNIIMALPQGSAVSLVCAASLYVHVLITYLIKGTVLSRAAHRLVMPSTLNDYGCRGTLTWFAISTSILFSCYGVASAIPEFGDLVDLLGALQTPIFGFMLPAAMRFVSKRPRPVHVTLLLIAIFILGLFLITVGTAGAAMSVAEAYSQ